MRRRRGAAAPRQALVLVLVALWCLPMAGLIVTSFRPADQVALSGWWAALTATTEQQVLHLEPGRGRDAGPDRRGVLALGSGGEVLYFGVSVRAPEAYPAGTTAMVGIGGSLRVERDGRYLLHSPEGPGPARIFYTRSAGPRLTGESYNRVLGAEGIGRAFVNTLWVAGPSTLIPTLVAAMAAYALAWTAMPGRMVLIALCLFAAAMPLQMALIPLLRLYGAAGRQLGYDGPRFLGVWLAHTGFGLPLAILLMRQHMAALPRALIDAARLDGATEAVLLFRIVLPLSVPVLAAFAAFQFVWTWNDLLVSMVFLGGQADDLVLSGKLMGLIGTQGGDWQLLSAATVVSAVVPLGVFVGAQRAVRAAQAAASHDFQ